MYLTFAVEDLKEARRKARAFLASNVIGDKMSTTTLSFQSEPRPEAMADVPGICELPLTRAVVQYRDIHEIDLLGGKIQDIGLALVLDGRFASSAEALDLGSSTLKVLDLSSELVVLDWVYEPTLEHVKRLIKEHAGSDINKYEGRLGAYCFQVALNLISRVGYGPLTRPTILRIGFRDICRDLDFHENTSVRIVIGDHSITRAYLDYDANSLVFRTPFSEPDAVFEAAVLEAFPRSEVLRVSETHKNGSMQYQVRFDLPVTLAEAREEIKTIRRGLGRLLDCFEPSHFSTVQHHLSTFGSRETLAQLPVRESHLQSVPLRKHFVGFGGGAVH